MAVGSVLLELTGIIQEKSAEVDKFIRERGLPQPSFDHSYPPILKLSPEADAARQAALEAIDELRCHLLGPLGVIMSHTSEVFTSRYVWKPVLIEHIDVTPRQYPRLASLQNTRSSPT
jgi:hypothetical protein